MTRLWSLLVKLWRSLVGAAGEMGAADGAPLLGPRWAKEVRLEREALESVHRAIERGEDVDDETAMRAERAARRQREQEAEQDRIAGRARG